MFCEMCDWGVSGMVRHCAVGRRRRESVVVICLKDAGWGSLGGKTDVDR